MKVKINPSNEDSFWNLFMVLLSYYNYIEILKKLKKIIINQTIDENSVNSAFFNFNSEDVNELKKILQQLDSKKKEFEGFKLNNEVSNIISSNKDLVDFYFSNLLLKSLKDMKLNEFYTKLNSALNNFKTNFDKMENLIRNEINIIASNLQNKDDINKSLNNFNEYANLIKNTHIAKLNTELKEDDLENFYKNQVVDKLKSMTDEFIKQSLKELNDAAKYVINKDLDYDNALGFISVAGKDVKDNLVKYGEALKNVKDEVKKEAINKLNAILTSVESFNKIFFFKVDVFKSSKDMSEIKKYDENKKCESIFANELHKFNYFKKLQEQLRLLNNPELKELKDKIDKMLAGTALELDYSKYQTFVTELKNKIYNIFEVLKISNPVSAEEVESAKKAITEIQNYFSTMNEIKLIMEKNLIKF